MGTFLRIFLSFLTGSLKYERFDLLTTNLDQKHSELEIHVNGEKGGISAKSKASFFVR